VGAHFDLVDNDTTVLVGMPGLVVLESLRVEADAEASLSLG